MAVYLIADIRVINQQRYEEYRLAVRDAITGHGGRHVVRTSKVEVIEGGWAPPRLVILEFPTGDAAEAFYHSPDYRRARDLRANATMVDMVLAEGIGEAALPRPDGVPAYVLTDTRVINRAKFDEFRQVIHGAVRKFGGNYLAFTDQARVIEGGWEPHTLMVVEFRDIATARAAYDSVQYREARDLGANSAMFDVVLVEGLPANADENSTFL